MKSSIKLGKIFGIDIKMNITFLFLLLWVASSSLLTGASLANAVTEVLFVIALFMIVVLHELGHALTARGFGISTTDITLLPIGGVAHLEKMPDDPKQEFMVAIAGPAVNLLLAGLLTAALLVFGFFNQPISMAMIESNLWARLLTANLSLFLFNLIPAFPMDGGRVLRSLLSLRMDPVKATTIAANIGKGVAVLMAIAGIIFNPWLVLIAIFVWIGANAESKARLVQESVKGLQVEDAMVSKFYQVEGNQPLGSVMDTSIQTGQWDIPVTSNGHFLGIIRRQDLLNALQRLGKRAPAYAAIGVEPEAISPKAPLKEVLTKFQNNRVLPVIENEKLIGLITPESFQQRLWLNRKMNNHHPPYPDEKKNTI